MPTPENIQSQGECTRKVDNLPKGYGIISNIQVYSLHDGPGVRTLVFIKGCPLKCRWCCNPEGQSPDVEVEFYQAKCVGCGACLKACTRKAINPDITLQTGFKINRELCDACGDCIEACPAGALKFIGRVVSVKEVVEEVPAEIEEEEEVEAEAEAEAPAEEKAPEQSGEES